MKKKRVLMIDNDRFSLSVLHRLLTDMGCEPLVGSTPEAANALLEGHAADVVIYNRDLEVEWGYSILDRLRRIPDSADIPVILLTQRAGRYAPRVHSDYETTVCFQKPVAIEPFVTVFRELVEGSRADLSRD